MQTKKQSTQADLQKNIRYYKQGEIQTQGQYEGHYAPAGEIASIAYERLDDAFLPTTIDQTIENYYNDSAKISEQIFQQTTADLDSAQSSILAKQSYTYDILGNLIKAQTQTADSDLVEKFYYNNQDDPAAEVIGLVTRYDRNSEATRYKYGDDHRLTQVNNVLIEYDHNGNMIKDIHGNQYQYNANNQLVGFDRNIPNMPDLKADYLYNPKGKRVQKAIHSNNQNRTVNYAYAKDKLIAELNNDDNKVNYYTPRLHILQDDSDRYTIHNRFLSKQGVSRYIIQQFTLSKNKWQYQSTQDMLYRAFGQYGTTSSANEHNQATDAIIQQTAKKPTGYMLYRNTYQDPETQDLVMGNGERYFKNSYGIGVFNQPDQNLKQGFNLYTWGGTKPTDPINYTDPSGNVSLSHLMLSGLFFLSGLLEFAAGNVPGGIADEVAAGFELDQGLTQQGDSKNDWVNFGFTFGILSTDMVVDYILIKSIDESFVKFQDESFEGYKVGHHGGPITRPINFDDLPEGALNNNEDGCPICYLDLEQDQKLIKGTSNHYYHSNCYETWIKTSKYDPMSKAPIRPIFRVNKGSYLAKLKQVIIGRVAQDYTLEANSLLENYFRRYKRIMLLRAISASLIDVPHMLIKPLPDNEQGDDNLGNIIGINLSDMGPGTIKMLAWLMVAE